MKTLLALAGRTPAGEKIPLSSKNGVADNGSIPKADVSKEVAEKPKKENMASSTSDDTGVCTPEKLGDSKADSSDLSCPESQPMSLFRKFAMFLSFLIIALYFVALAWLIPCRLLQCSIGGEWTMNLDNVSISTNLEVSGPFRSELLLFGHFEENEDSKGVTALTSSTGSVKWKIPLDFRPARCHCGVVDINGDDVLDCLIFGKARLLALNASDGHMFWTRGFRKISFLVAVVNDCDTEGAKWIAVIESPSKKHVRGRDVNDRIRMVILDSKHGTVVRNLSLSCDSIPKQLITWKSKSNITQIAFQCSYRGNTEVKLFSEEELCGLILGRGVSKMEDFSVLFRFGSSTSADDVFLLPVSHVGLVVGWWTMVAMATDARNSPRLLWQTTSGSIRSAIKFISKGHFASRNSVQIAIVLHEESSSSVKIVNVPDGEEVASVDLGSGKVTAILPVSRKTETVDSLLIVKQERISVASGNHTATDALNFTEETTYTPDMLEEVKTYLLLTVDKGNNVTRLIIGNRRTEVAVTSADCTTLFIATPISNHTTTVSSRVLIDSSKGKCSCS